MKQYISIVITEVLQPIYKLPEEDATDYSTTEGSLTFPRLPFDCGKQLLCSIHTISILVNKDSINSQIYPIKYTQIHDKCD